MIELRRGSDRAVTVHEGCEARHGFAFGAHYDPENTFFGALLAHNEERLAPGSGYPTHAHREADLVTWVTDGALDHTDSLGNARTVLPGSPQVLAAGTGVEHAEHAGGPAGVRFVQAWLVPDALAPPTLHTRDFTTALAAGEPVLIASGRAGTTVLPLRRADAELWAARLPPGAEWVLPTAPFVHVHLARGSTGELGEGDELRITGSAEHALTAGAAGAEVLVWAMHSDLRPA